MIAEKRVNKKRRLLTNKGSPIVEEMMLIGVAVLVFVLMFTMLQDMLDWALDAIQGFF